MKIAWVTPFAARSAIGRVSATVIEALCDRNHEVTIIRSERAKLSQALSRSTSVPISWWQDVSPQKIYLETDVIVLNFGDNYDLHAGTLAFAGTVPCLGIFHDFYLYNLFNRWLVHNGLGEDVHNREARRVYGEGVVPLATKAWRNEAAVAADRDISSDDRMAGPTLRRGIGSFAILRKSARSVLPRADRGCPSLL